MKFKRGNKKAKGGRRPGAGRKSNEEKEQLAMVPEAIKKYVESRLKPVLDAYLSLGSGRRVGKAKRKLDPTTCRHVVERFLPPATKRIEIQDNRTAEWFYAQVEKEMQEEQAALPGPDPEKDPNLN